MGPTSFRGTCTTGVGGFARVAAAASGATGLMTEKRVRHLVVRDAERISGVVSIGDVVKAIIDDQQFTIEQLEHYISGG